MIIKTITIDLASKGVSPVIDVMQGDSLTRGVKIKLYNGNVPYDYSGIINKSFSVAFEKPDGVKGWYDTLPNGDPAVEDDRGNPNIVTVLFAPAMLEVVGSVKATLVLVDTQGKQLASFPFLVNVVENPAYGNHISNEYYNIKTFDEFYAKLLTSFVSTDVVQTLTAEQKAQARKNIGALGNSPIVRSIEISDESGGRGAYIIPESYVQHEELNVASLGFYGILGEEPTILRNIADGILDTDAATVGQLNAAVGDIETTLNRKTTYTNLYGKVEITADDIIAAGDEGITCITIGSDDVDMSKYDDILIKLFVPDSSALNSANGMMGIYATNTSAPIITGDKNSLIRPSSANISTACFFHYNRQNILSVKTEWSCDTFHHGLVIKNGYSDSIGYAGVTNGWTCISHNYVKSEKRYFHIIGNSTGQATFKFPAGTYVEVFAR